MEKRAYFLLGDLAGNIATGALAALASAALLGGLPMFISMPLSMILGMFIGMILLYGVLLRLFGAMEPMLQTMTTGMFAGMLAVMNISSDAQLLPHAIYLGAEVGIAVFVLSWLLNAAISGPQTIREDG